MLAVQLIPGSVNIIAYYIMMSRLGLLNTLLGLGLIFQMPVVIFVLARFGLVTAKFLWKNFKYAVLIIFIVAAVASPGQDPASQLLFAAPMLVLYIISIGVAWVFGKKKPAEIEDE